jgi:hypothetical protein
MIQIANMVAARNIEVKFGQLSGGDSRYLIVEEEDGGRLLKVVEGDIIHRGRHLVIAVINVEFLPVCLPR